MAKFVFLFVALCLAQNFHRTLADLEKVKNHKFIKMLTLEMEKQLHDSSKLLEEHYYDKQVKKDIKDNNISLRRIFKFARKEIEELSTKDLECTEMAYEELEALQEKTRTDAGDCNLRGKKKTLEVIDDAMDDLRKKTQTSLIDDFGMKCAKCAIMVEEDPEADEDDILQCLDVEEGMKIRQKLLEETTTVITIFKIILEQVVKDVNSCLGAVKINALKNTEHVIDEFKFCIM